MERHGSIFTNHEDPAATSKEEDTMDDLEIKPGVVIPGYELWFTACRSGGPGGQHANKTSSAVTLHWVPANNGSFGDDLKGRVLRKLSSQLTNDGELQVTAQDERSQHRNRDIARERLAEIVRAAMKRKKRRIRTRPSRAAKRRRVENKRQRGQLKEKRKNPNPNDY